MQPSNDGHIYLQSLLVYVNFIPLLLNVSISKLLNRSAIACLKNEKERNNGHVEYIGFICIMHNNLICIMHRLQITHLLNFWLGYNSICHYLFHCFQTRGRTLELELELELQIITLAHMNRMVPQRAKIIVFFPTNNQLTYVWPPLVESGHCQGMVWYGMIVSIFFH